MGTEYWLSEDRGLIRQRGGPGSFQYPEVWCASDRQWEIGSPYVMDAITGMGEDVYSCGEWADRITLEEAQTYAAAHGIELGVDNPDDWGDTGVVAWAARIARHLHEGQTDKAGNPYFGHCERVARKLSDDEDRAVGLLHDVVEDTDKTADELRSLARTAVRKDMADRIVDAVVALTRVDGEAPERYYERIRSNPMALRVKLADIHDNLDPSRMALLDEGTWIRLLRKYGAALVQLAGPGTEEYGTASR